MAKKMESLEQPLIDVVNTLLATGRGLPIPKRINSVVSKTRLFTYDHFLMVETDPRIEKKVTQKVI